MNNEQAILDFCAVTGASTDVAEDYLQIADGNVETAVTLYLESGGQNVSQNAARHTSSTASSSPRSTGDNAAESDEEIARRLQQQEERGRQQVRAPIAPRRDILTGGGSPFEHNSMWSSPAGSTRTRHTHRSVFNQGDSYTGSPGPDFFRNLEAGSSRNIAGNLEESQLTAKAKRLADLFRPPFDIMFKGGFEEARASAKEQTKWMLVNIQDQTEFSCQVLNRDLWSDKIVKEIIRESFVFLQYDCESPEGKRYLTLYPIGNYPHIAIIDSRTGERVKTWEKVLSPTDFVMDITEFLEQRSPDRPHAANVSDMSEEEQIKAAIAASLGKDDSEEAEVAAVENPVQPTAAEQEEDTKEVSKLDAIQAVKRDEPTDMENSTRIQLRMADGKRVIRRFMKTDPVQYLFEFVKAEFPEAQTRPFELVFNRKQLIQVLDQQIAEAGLVNAAVNLVFL